MHVTIGLRASRTWHVWLQRVHGRIASAVAGAQLGDEVGVGDLGPRHLDAVARAGSSSPSAHSAWPTSTIEPCRNTGTSTGAPPIDAGTASMLNPVGSWKSGRVFSTEKIEPRTTTR